LKTLLYEGKAKKVYSTDDERYYLIEYKDDATAFDGQKKGSISGKGVINNRMSNMIFQMLEKNNIPTHFVEEVSSRETIVKKVDIIPIEVIVRNRAAGSFSKRYGVEEGRKLTSGVLEFCLKDDALHDPFINEYIIKALDIASNDDITAITRMAFDINDALSAYFAKAKLRLIDFKIEFGRCRTGDAEEGKIILADEISPDTCRLWDMDTNEKLDKDRFRRDLGKVEEAYEEVFQRLKLMQESEGENN